MLAWPCPSGLPSACAASKRAAPASADLAPPTATYATAFRDRIRELHANQTPLVDMVVELGLEGQMTPEIRAIVERLPEKVVAAIRQATIDMLDRTG